MPRPRPAIVAIGDAIVDIATPPIAHVPEGDAQLSVPRIDLLPGGNATNFALQSAALGARTRFIGCVGSDDLSAVLRRAYRSLGVRAALRVDGGLPTGTTVALTRGGARRILITSIGANASLAERDVTRASLDGADHVHRAGFWWTPRLMGLPTGRILAGARRAGASTSLDIATDPLGWPDRRVDLVRSCLPHVTTFFGNETEATAIADTRDPVSAAREICRLGAEEVVLHRGARGALWVSGARRASVRAYRVPEHNPTGCGDVFNAAYVSSRLDGSEVRRALAFANACAALHLRDRIRPYPPRAVVERFLRNRP